MTLVTTERTARRNQFQFNDVADVQRGGARCHVDQFPVLVYIGPATAACIRRHRCPRSHCRGNIEGPVDLVGRGRGSAGDRSRGTRSPDPAEFHGKVRLFDQGMGRVVQDRREIEADMNEAIDWADVRSRHGHGLLDGTRMLAMGSPAIAARVPGGRQLVEAGDVIGGGSTAGKQIDPCCTGAPQWNKHPVYAGAISSRRAIGDHFVP